jgi:hypothetical protein
VVNFIGACHKPGQRCLVTEYCARGSLDQVLHKSGGFADLLSRCLAGWMWPGRLRLLLLVAANRTARDCWCIG